MPSPTEITEPTSVTSMALVVVLDLLAQNTGYFVRSNLSHNFLPIIVPC